MTNGHWPFYLKIDGESVKDAMINSLRIRQELGQHYWCEVDFRLIGEQKPPIADYLGKSLEFVTWEGSELSIFEGLVLESELEYGLHGDYVARLRAVTRTYLLQLTSEENYFLKKNLEEVAKQVTSEDNVPLQFTAKGNFAKMNYVQWGETDFDFLRRIADDQGCCLRPTPKGLEIHRGFQETGLRLRWHDEYGLIRFSLKGRLGQPSVNGTCYDARTMHSRTFRKIKKEAQFFAETAGNLIEAVKSQSQQLPSARLVFDGRAPTVDKYQAMLEKESARAIGSKVIATGISRNPRLKPGDKVRLEGANFDAQGEYGVIAVTHSYDQSGGYINTFTASPWKDYTWAEPPEPRLMNGVVSARVVSHNDPRGMGRVQIKYDWMEKGQTAWARMTTPHAGGGRGFMFMPEAGDEVLVAFEHGDPERPYVIGALWNGVDTAPRQGFWEDEGTGNFGSRSVPVPKDVSRNDVKRIVTKSGHRIQLVDVKGKESIVISTPGGQIIQLIDSCDETGGRKMLSLTSPGDIYLNAPNGRVHIRSKLFSKEVG